MPYAAFEYFCSYQLMDVLIEMDLLSQPAELRRLLTTNHTVSR